MKDFKYKEWEFTKNSYINWLHNTSLKNFIFDNFKFDKLSLWHSNNLFERDNTSEELWHIKLNNLLHNRENTYKNSNSLYKLFYSFIRTICKYLILKIFIKKNLQKEIKYVFISEIYNLDKSNEYQDRFYTNLPSNVLLKSDTISLIKATSSIRNIFNYISNNENKNKEIYILDKYINLNDIFNVYFSFFILIIKSYFLKRKLISYMFINNVDVSKVLFPYMIKSFENNNPSSILYAKTIYRILKYRKLTVITYGEFLPDMIPFYHYVKQENIKVVTMQHATFGVNKWNNNYFPDEFEFNGQQISIPDYYLVHGKQFKNILSKYYPVKNIYEVGSLKYDNINLSKRSKNYNKFKTIGLFLSNGDQNVLLILYSKLKNYFPEYKFIVCIHPHYKNQTFSIAEEINISTIDFELNKKSLEILSIVDICIYSASSIFLEAILLDVPTIIKYTKVTFTQSPLFINGENGDLIFETNNDDTVTDIIKSSTDINFNNDQKRKNILNNFIFNFDKNISNIIAKKILEISENA